MRFWISVSVCIAVVTALWTVMFVNNPDLRRSSAPKPSLSVSDPAVAEQAKLPKAVVGETVVKIDNLPQAHQGERTFKISNGGKAPLELLPLKPGCTCAGVRLEKKRDDGKVDFIVLTAKKDTKDFETEFSDPSLANITLQPGEESTLILKFDTRDRLGRVDVGTRIRTNDPLKTMLNFKLDLEVKNYVIVEPHSVQFGPLREGRVSEKKLAVYSTLRDDLDISELKTTNPAISIEKVAMTEDEKKPLGAMSGYYVTVTSDGSLPVGGVFEKLAFKTNIDNTPQLDVEITGTVDGQIKVSPRNVNFRVVKPTAKHEKRVQISAAGFEKDGDLALGEIKPDFVIVKLTHHPTYKSIWTLNVRLKEDAPPGPIKGQIWLVDKDKKNKVRITLHGTVAGATAPTAGGE